MATPSTPIPPNILHIRLACVCKLKSVVGDEKYSTDLERQIFFKSGRPDNVVAIRCAYYRLFNRVFFNLKNNGKVLVQQYSPMELVLVDDATLAKGTAIHSNWTQYKKDIKHYRMLLNNQNSDEDLGETGLTCSKCGNNKRFEIVLKQTRSADEPMTSFITCAIPDCRHRFKC